ncbi:MAG: 3-deoxy-manno-octulosonate cytidylyltransferase [Planctomycetota bacterium]
MPNVVAIIPARYESTRFPGKALADRTGRTLIQHVHERVVQSRLIEQVIVATDDERIAAAVASFGGDVVMTRSDHPNGTCRIAEAAAALDARVIVNVQGDEPEIEPDLIDLAIRALEDRPDCPVATLASPFAADEDPADPNIVKGVTDRDGAALYFSRALIPHPRVAGGAGAAPLKHVGMYVYRRAFLLAYPDLSPTPLEQTERLEQLRVLEHGHKIAVAVGDARWHGIDTPAQYDEFVQRVQRQLT